MQYVRTQGTPRSAPTSSACCAAKRCRCR
jgi:hypothetical protein